MTLVTLLMVLSVGQAPQLTGPEGLFPLRAGDQYTYWYEFGEKRDTLDMRVLDVSLPESRVEGFPLPAQLAGGGEAGARVLLKVLGDTGMVRCEGPDGVGFLLTIPAGATLAPVSTWAANYDLGLTVDLPPSGPITGGKVTLAQGHGIVALEFTTAEGSGEYVLLEGPVAGPAQTLPDAVITFEPSTRYTYMREDVLGRTQHVCDAGSPQVLDGIHGVTAVGVPWFDQAGERPLESRERTVAIDIPGRRWLEIRDGKPLELLRFNVMPCIEPVVVPAGRFVECYRLVSARPGLEAILAPDTGIVRWTFDTIVGPVRYELIRKTAIASTRPVTDTGAGTGGTAEPVTPEGPDEPAVGPTEPAGPDEPPVGPEEPVTGAGGTGAELAGPVGPPDPGETGATEPTEPTEPAGPPEGGTPTQPVGPTAAASGYVGAADGTVFRVAADGEAVSVAQGLGETELVASTVDGSSVAWVSANAGGKSVYTLTAGATAPEEAVRVTTGEGEVDHLQWSPDGQRLVFTRGSDILIYTPASGAVDTLVRGTRPRWISPNTIIYESGSDPKDEEVGVLRTSLGGTQSQMLLPWAFDATTSGDGMVLAYAYPREDDDPHLYVKYGRRETRVTGSTRYDRNPALSPDGRYLAFVRFDATTADGGYSIRLLDRTTGIESELAGGLKAWPRVEFGADGSLICAAIPDEGPTTCFRVRAPAGENPTEALAFGDMRPTIVVPFGAPARRP